MAEDEPDRGEASRLLDGESAFVVAFHFAVLGLRVSGRHPYVVEMT